MSVAASRLARSRQAIVEQMAHTTPRPGRGEPAGWLARLRTTAGSWWRNHPARLALELASPVVSTYAGRAPWRLLAVAAATGALIVVFRPWRLLTVSGVLLAVAKSSQFSSLLLSALGTVDGGRPRDPGSGRR